VNPADVIVIARRTRPFEDDPRYPPGERKTRAAAQLAPVITAISDLTPNLFQHGFKLALQDDMAGTCNGSTPDGISAETRERLTIARDMIRRQMTSLLTVPQGTLIVYRNAAITLLGDRPVLGTTAASEDCGWTFR
jgi:hypothetical protein